VPESTTAPTEPRTDPQVTIVVVPRERFSVSLRSLTTLIGCTTDVPYELVYVDGGSPPAIRERLREEAGRYGFTLVREERYLSPNQARNLGLRHVTTPYVVFIDNDVIVTPGWLQPLIDCAEETGAWVVGPLNFEGEFEDMEVHNAGGFLEFVGPEGQQRLLQENRYGHRHRTALPEGLERFPCDYVEFHCVLVRRSAFDAIGPLDEELLSTREHLDLCLQVTRAGGEVWSDLTSFVTYDHPPPITRTDLPFFLTRWSEEWNWRSVRRFMAKYGLSDEYLERIGGPRARRHVTFRPLKRLVGRTLGDDAEDLANRVLMGLELGANRALVGPRAKRLADHPPR
jgi:GT2 family glycosyltransferase